MSPVIPGVKFNRLTIIEEIESMFMKNGNRKRMCLCRCECGLVKEILFDSVSRGTTKSCGCLNKEQISALGAASVKHGLKDHSLYQRWQKIKGRCVSWCRVTYPNYSGGKTDD